jgi:glycosyltransferase involved in cell wall biosynthesis
LDEAAQQAPKKLLHWLEENPQDVLFINGCDQVDAVIPYLPPSLKCVYVVHDTAPQYWRTVLKEEKNLESVVAVSETVASQFRHQLKQTGKLAVILNGSVFPQQPEPNELRQDELIFLGGDNPTKGAFDVLKLWKQLLKLGFAGKLHWFGNVSPAFQAKIDHLPARERIHVYGRVKREHIFSTAASAKLLLMLSRVEPFGMATIEAMSMGCVPVAWDIDTGTKEIVAAGATGFYAQLGNIRDLASRVFYACDNYQAFSAAVIAHARSTFDEAVMWKGYESLIGRIAALAPIQRSQQDREPTPYKPPIRRFQLLPTPVRSAIRGFIGRSPYLGYWLRDLRGL